MESGQLLIALTTSLLAATVGGVIAVRMGQSPVVGFIVAGVVIGPSTPGFVGDLQAVHALADIGVVFLMFSIGTQVSVTELRRVGTLVAVGGTMQVLAMIGIGYAVGLAIGWSSLASLFLGCFVSISSTAVAARILTERGETETEHAHVALGWLAVQDLLTIVLIVLLTSIGAGGDAGATILALGQAAGFLVLVIPIGRRVIPRVFELLASYRRRELFILGVVGIALGTAALGTVFGISLALGAFLAGILVEESDLSHQVMGEIIPFRDVFAGLFFVSVGMLVDPGLIAGSLPLVVLVLALIVPVKAVLVGIIGAAFRYPARTTGLAAIPLAQSAEFSFVLGRIGSTLGILNESEFGLMLTAAAVSIVVAPAAFASGRPLIERIDARSTPPADPAVLPDDRRRIAVICGYGRVGQLVAAALERRGFSFVIIEQNARAVREARARGIAAIRGTAENPAVLERAPLSRAVVVVVALPDPLAVRLVVDHVRRGHPRMPIVARTHSTTERSVLREIGATDVVVGEVELGLEMTRFALRQFGISGPELQALINGLRSR
ncbi:MAG TPA: cation:proton antiporter [Candidatus Eisenbacteria bacterium]|nr:cation:proton antiporter [Candidatus Eisenbacteria bacterium]